MEKNPFEAGNNKRKNQFSTTKRHKELGITKKQKELGITKKQKELGTKKKSILPKVLLILSILIIAVGIYRGPISNKIAEIRLERQLAEIKDKNAYFRGDNQLLSQGTMTSISNDEAYIYPYTEFIEDGESYHYLDIEPGVYTVELVAGDKVVFAGENWNSIGYTFGQEEHDAVVKELTNMTIKDGDNIFAECEAGTDFKLKLTPQDEYIEFDQDNIVPGAYTAGINIDPGTYSFSSKSDEDINLTLYNSDTKGVISSDEYDSFTLNAGDFIVVDDENTLIELQ